MILRALRRFSNYFKVLGVAENFSIDLAQIKNNFIQKQRESHPDKIGESNQSAVLNKAFETLKNPLSRAKHLYSLKTHSVWLDEKNEQNDEIDEDVLIKVLDVRNSISEATDKSEIECIREENEERISECLEDLEAAFESNSLDTVRNLIFELKYWVTVREACDDKTFFT